MIYLLKRFYPLIILTILIFIPVWVLCGTRTNSYLTLKGDTMPFESVIEIDTDNNQEGKFSTIYVISMQKSTIFQNILADMDPKIERGELSKASQEISDIDSYKASKIQYYSSIESSLILAYNEAKKDDSDIILDYEFYSYDITYKSVDSQFKIGDKIIGMNDITNDDMDLLLNNIRNPKIGDKCIIIRDDKEMEITLAEGEGYYGYPRFNIDNALPKYKLNDNAVGGPSGGLLQSLSIYNRLTKEDLTHGLSIAGTGTIDINGNVGMIGGIREKIPTAIDDDVDVFFCVSGNYIDALESYNSIPNRNKMKLIKVDTFYDCINYLKEGYKDDFKNL